VTVVVSTAHPVEQALQEPFTQSAAPWQVVLQLPQLWASVFWSTQVEPQLVSPT